MGPDRLRAFAPLGTAGRCGTRFLALITVSGSPGTVTRDDLPAEDSAVITEKTGEAVACSLPKA